MARALPRLALAAGLCLMILALQGCPGDAREDEDAPPRVIVTLAVLGRPDAYRLNGTVVGGQKLHDQLRTIADDNRQPKTDLVNAVVRLHTESGANYDEVRDLQDFCVSIGLSHIENDQ